MNDPITPAELDAYVDGQLDLERRYAVEHHLSAHPELAARVMADLGTRSGLQLLYQDLAPARAEIAGLAQRLQAPRRRHRFGPAAMAAALGFIAISALLLSRSQAPPDYVIDAEISHRAAMLRATMASQLESPGFDADEILKATQISMPSLPEGWHVTDVQLFPSQRGLALLIAVKTSAGQPLSIFALRQRSNAPARPDAVREGLYSVAYWSENGMSYALTGDDEPSAIDATAETLAELWRS